MDDEQILLHLLHAIFHPQDAATAAVFLSTMVMSEAAPGDVEEDLSLLRIGDL